MTSYQDELMDQHADLCLQIQKIDEYPTEERLKIEQTYEELTKQIQSYCL